MDKKQRKELFKKLEKLPKSVQKALTSGQIARHIKVMEGVRHG